MALQQQRVQVSNLLAQRAIRDSNGNILTDLPNLAKTTACPEGSSMSSSDKKTTAKSSTLNLALK